MSLISKVALKKFFRRKLVMGLVILLILIGGGAIFIHILSSPAQGVVQSTPPEASAASNQPTTAAFSGKYISLIYPTTYKPIPLALSGSYLEVLDLYSINHLSNEITVGVVRATLATDSGVSYRQQHPALYSQQTIPSGLAFVGKSSSFERTVFITHGDLVASISALSPNGSDLTADSDFIQQSLTWKQ